MNECALGNGLSGIAEMQGEGEERRGEDVPLLCWLLTSIRLPPPVAVTIQLARALLAWHLVS